MKRFSFHQDRLETVVSSRKVFDDPKRIRARRARAVVIALVTAVLCWAILFLDGSFSLQSALRELNPFYRDNRSHVHPAGDSNGQHELTHLASASPVPQAAPGCEAGHKQPVFSAMADPGDPRVFGHVPVSSEGAFLSLEDSCGQLGVVVPEWISIVEEQDRPAVSLISKDTRISVEEYMSAAAVRPQLLPAVLLGEKRKEEAFLDNIADAAQAPALAEGMAAAVAALNAQGACLDFTGLDPEAFQRLRPLMERFSDTFRSRGLTACTIFAGSQAEWKDAELTDLFDQIILKLFQEPWAESVPGPLAPYNWIEDVAAEAVQAIGAKKLVVAIGNFAVEWTSGSSKPERLSYSEAMQRMSAAGADLRFSAKSSNSFSRYRDAEGQQRKIWMLDAASAHNQLLRLKQLGIANVAVWSLGQEDPGIWKVLQHQNAAKDVLQAELAVAELNNFVDYKGQGAFIRIDQRASAGVRQLTFEAETGLITEQSYSRLPKPYSIELYGKPERRKLVLTFDDGPHERFTKEILDILQEEQVPGAFFVVGTSVMNSPDLVARMVDEGHEIGAHSFSHPRMDQISQTRVDLEFALLDKILAGSAGRKTMLYREPFQRRGGPISAERAASLEAAEARGFTIAGMEIVPKDWEGWDSGQIANYVIGEVEQGNGNVILLHDGGLDRTATVEAVRPIIRSLRAKGYEFTTLADLLGTNRAALMPVAQGGSPAFDRVSFSMVWMAQQAVVVVFWVVLAIGLLRSAGILILALLNRRERFTPLQRQPKVAVVIPAHNEAKVIAQCVESVRASGYKNLEIIVVDDGSTDDTLLEVLKFGHKSEVRLISQPNQGKWSALNRAIQSTDAEFAVCIDADTQVCKDAITHLVRHFADPKTGAVAGKIIAGNRVNLLTRLQAFEYATSQNVERKAFDLINGILVVPGAIGAWRVEALKKAGLFSEETLTEDTDLTIQVNRAGYTVVFEPKAKAYTEVPEKVGQLLKQRLRWSLGMFQSAWKHKRAILEGRPIGLVSISDMFVFGYVFPLLAPIADLFVIFMLYNLMAGGWTGDVGSTQQVQTMQYLWAFLALPALELLIAAIAITTDKDESNWSLLLFPLQRLVYRPLLYFSVIRSILRAVTGRLANWGSVKRHGRDYGLVAGNT
ncbi:glycosyltransferase [Leisingera aquaemixtae]|uniref:glycosyltransferase n=1 Tax=Leisingera aquaemixtae TaxID=1396826 RepID=UPI0021A85E6E|nr:glycosyltransferase [Leisingera aquaemixtae]UWQ38210.1 glycosyltransferase [Leisingera aquaemixtae]